MSKKNYGLGGGGDNEEPVDLFKFTQQVYVLSQTYIMAKTDKPHKTNIFCLLPMDKLIKARQVEWKYMTEETSPSTLLHD